MMYEHKKPWHTLQLCKFVTGRSVPHSKHFPQELLLFLDTSLSVDEASLLLAVVCSEGEDGVVLEGVRPFGPLLFLDL